MSGPTSEVLFAEALAYRTMANGERFRLEELKVQEATIVLKHLNATRCVKGARARVFSLEEWQRWASTCGAWSQGAINAELENANAELRKERDSQRAVQLEMEGIIQRVDMQLVRLQMLLDMAQHRERLAEEQLRLEVQSIPLTAEGRAFVAEVERSLGMGASESSPVSSSGAAPLPSKDDTGEFFPCPPPRSAGSSAPSSGSSAGSSGSSGSSTRPSSSSSSTEYGSPYPPGYRDSFGIHD